MSREFVVISLRRVLRNVLVENCKLWNYKHPLLHPLSRFASINYISFSYCGVRHLCKHGVFGHYELYKFCIIAVFRIFFTVPVILYLLCYILRDGAWRVNWWHFKLRLFRSRRNPPESVGDVWSSWHAVPQACWASPASLCLHDSWWLVICS